MPYTNLLQYSGNICEPLFPDEAATMAVRIGPNLTLVAGTIISQITTATGNDVQTLDFTATVSGGTFTLSIKDGYGNSYTTAALDWNITNAALKIALDALLETAGYHGGTVTITNGAAPLDTTITIGGTLAGRWVPLLRTVTALPGGGSMVTVHTTPGITKGVYEDNLDGQSDGTQIAIGILAVDVVTDYDGRIVLGGQATSEHGQKLPTAPMYYKGTFRCGDLTGLDAAGVTDMGRMLYGAFSDAEGILHIG